MYLLEESEDLRPVLCIAAQQVRNPANQPTGRKLSVEDDIIIVIKKSRGRQSISKILPADLTETNPYP
jgi:hypothetical protein